MVGQVAAKVQKRTATQKTKSENHARLDAAPLAGRHFFRGKFHESSRLYRRSRRRGISGPVVLRNALNLHPTTFATSPWRERARLIVEQTDHPRWLGASME